MTKLYHYDHGYFASSTDAADYWAGFIAADGYIHRKSVRVSQKDQQHLEKLARSVGTNSPVRLRAHGVYEICLYSPQMCNDLCERYNIVPSKSLILKGPELINERSCANFIRGYTDGDGCICQRRACNTWDINWVSGSNDILQWVKNRIDWYLPDTHGKIRKRQRGYILSYHGRQCCDIVAWLYQNSTSDIRLDRKYALSVDLQQWYIDHPPHVPRSSYTGVYQRKNGGWFAQISIGGQKIHLGETDSELEAALLWNDAVIQHGLDRVLNNV